MDGFRSKILNARLAGGLWLVLGAAASVTFLTWAWDVYTRLGAGTDAGFWAALSLYFAAIALMGLAVLLGVRWARKPMVVMAAGVLPFAGYACFVTAMLSAGAEPMALRYQAVLAAYAALAVYSATSLVLERRT